MQKCIFTVLTKKNSTVLHKMQHALSSSEMSVKFRHIYHFQLMKALQEKHPFKQTSPIKNVIFISFLILLILK